MNNVHALSGAYAVDALDDTERIEFEQHLVECGTCRAEVDSLLEAVALLPETTSEAPPATLRQRVLADIAAVRPLPPVVSLADRRRAKRRRIPALVAAAAALIALGGVGQQLWDPWEDETSVGELSATQRVLAAEDAESWSQRLPGGARAKVTRSEELNQAVLETENMAPPGEGLIYEIWLVHDDQMVRAGLMPEGRASTVLLEGDPRSASGAGITVEPAGGSDVPTTEPFIEFSFERA